MPTLPQSSDHPSLCFPRMVSQLKALHQTLVSSAELFSQLMRQEIPHVTELPSEYVFF